MMRNRLVIAFLALPFLAACESYLAAKHDIAGASARCLITAPETEKNKVAATTGSMALGAFLRHRMGTSLYLIDEFKTAEALESSCDGEATTWRNPDTRQRYAVTPTQTYYGQSGRCRDFTIATEVQGREEVIRGTACRQADGTWKAA